MDEHTTGYVTRALEVYWEHGVPELAERGARVATERVTLLQRRVIGRLRHSRHASGKTDANPHAVKSVDPAGIEYVLATRIESRPTGRHFEVARRPAVAAVADYGDVLGGEWDQERVPVTEWSEWELITRRFVDGADWTDLDLYDECLERFRSDHSVWGCTSEAELHDRFAYLDRLAASIASEGYQRNTDPDDFIGTRGVGPDRLDEITVDIGRDGTLLHYVNGRHRLALAETCDVDEIPVVVRVRHSDWQAVRDEVNAADSPEQLSERSRQLLDHPDLGDIVPNDWRV